MTRLEFAQVLRALAMLAAAGGALYALRVLAWYVAARLLTPARAWHVASTALGWLLVEVLMFAEVLQAWGQPPLFLRAPLCLASNLFVFLGLHALYRRARALEEHRTAGTPPP